MAKKQTPPPKAKKPSRGRPPLPEGTVQTRISLPPGTLDFFTNGAHQAGMAVPQFIGLCARHGFKAGLNAALGLPQMEEAA